MIVRHEPAGFQGRELDPAGDGFFAAFDGPARAVLAAAALRDSLRAIGLEVRAGLHTGECKSPPAPAHSAARLRATRLWAGWATARTMTDVDTDRGAPGKGVDR